MASVLVARHLTKRFKDLTAVDDVSLEVAPGEILGLLGPNGAGKTTTFQMLLGLLTPTTGTIEYFGKDFTQHRTDILERINFSSTYTNLPWNLRVRDTLAFVSRLYRIDDRKGRVNEIVSSFRLEELLRKSVVELSAGELTRLNLAKAFINDPEMVLLDEPTASLDPESAHLVRRYILERRAQKGMAVLFTSHNMAEVEDVCDRIVFIHKGRVVANDTPANLARTIDTSTVSLVQDPSHEAACREVCGVLDITMRVEPPQWLFTMREASVPPFLTALTERGIVLHGLTVERASLEDYFLAQATTQSAGDT